MVDAGVATTMELRILGPVEAWVDGERVGLGAPKQRALLAMLLLNANRVVSRDRLVAAVWGEDPPEAAAAALQVYVHGLRRALGASRIQTHGSGYQLRVEPDELDLTRFERLLDRGQAALADGLAADAEEDLGAALALFVGPPFADLPEQTPLVREAGRLDELRLRATELRNDAQLALGRHEQLVEQLPGLIAEQPFRERLRYQQMLALYRCGRQKEALEAYQAARRMLVDELGVEPSPSLQDLERAILRHDPVLAAPSSRQRRAGRLPASPTPLIGRQLELAAITALFARGDVRQVTLTGAGGSGKTRLALAVAEKLAAELRDGAVFVDLAPVDDVALLLPSLADALGVQDSQPLEDALADDLRGRAGLLVLDNFEHLLPAAPFVARLLVEAPRLLVLVTSRAPLRIRWEHEYPVAPLTPPAPTGKPAFADVAANDAVRLFSARAAAANSTFALIEANAAAVAAICRRLDGLPLAIELAAAHSRLLPPERLLEALDTTLPLLTSGPVDLPPRQQTLRATLDWSYQLLTVPERSLLARLGVFSGGCTPDAVEAICGDLTIDTLPTLAALVDHSLLRRTTPADEPPRLSMLETIREYALEQLRSAGEEEHARAGHADYFTALAEQADQAISTTADPGPALRQLDSELDNLRAALGHLSQHRRAEQALRLASSLSLYWRIRAHLTEGRFWLEQMLALDGEIPAPLQAAALSNAGRLAYRQGDYSRAQQLHERALEVARDADDRRAVGQALSDLAGVSMAEGRLDRADELYAASAEVLRAAGHQIRLGTVLNNRAAIRIDRGDFGNARRFAAQALTLQKETGDKEGRVFTLLTLASIDAEERRSAKAGQRLEQCLALIRELDYREVHGPWLLTCAEVLYKRDRLDAAATLIAAADTAYDRAGVSQLQAGDQRLRAAILDAALAALGTQTLHQTLAEAGQLTGEDALEYAAAQLQTTPHKNKPSK